MKKTKDLRTDEELIVAYMAGDERAFTTIYYRHRKAVYTTAYFIINDSETSKDILQITMTKAAVALRENRFDGKQASLATWLSRIAKNQTIDVVRENARPKNSPASVVSIDIHDYPYVVDESGELACRCREIISDFHILTEGMRPIYKDCLLQYAVQGKTNAELAVELDTPINTIKRHIHVARVFMREHKKELC